ncbi:trans-sialidase [Trypanosoma cruzi]|uniref:Trans-sialidase, putative n=1 Tax=Trypanosoma cruzi (strain CL Brener) TaxID=353153 RepID=Q4DL65_TRYCC|nr:trans-sialidase, putative [Trypanosoma cruzi]EAN93268.1 trans-sialidase, putative [Trypanosoma cruzi]RNC45507.1 trans-sialidase [Trypanosoma cruzi]|eukprot:XP_815119.1 trans-sialidase [Trypanosoma cruzi strain CL Brener]
MGNGMLVFPVEGVDKDDNSVSMIVHSTDNGSIWTLCEDISPAKCGAPRVTEWEGSLLMIVDCKDGQRVYESCDMGATWTEAIGTLPGVWTKSQPGDYQDVSLRVDALITATIGGRKLMLYTHKASHPLEASEPNALCLWVTDNNRTFSVWPVAVDNNKNWDLASNLPYSDGALHLLKERANEKGRAISLARLTEELKTIKSVLRTWAQLDASFSASSTPTAGLVAVLSNTSSGGDTWIDDYHSVNATVRNAVKVHDGFRFMGFWFRGDMACEPSGEQWAAHFCKLQFYSCGDGDRPQSSEDQHYFAGRGAGRTHQHALHWAVVRRGRYVGDSVQRRDNEIRQHLEAGERIPGGDHAVGRRQGLRVRGWCDCGEPGDATDT